MCYMVVAIHNDTVVYQGFSRNCQMPLVTTPAALKLYRCHLRTVVEVLYTSYEKTENLAPASSSLLAA